MAEAMSKKRRILQEFAEELRAAFPHAVIECELLDRGGAWTTLHGPARVLEIQWSPDAGSYGVSLADEDADVALTAHDQYLPTFELAKAHVFALLSQPDALGSLVARKSG